MALGRRDARHDAVYAIQPGRGVADAATVLGADVAGILVRDGWAPYRRFTAATHQTCLAHLLRRARTLRLDYPRARCPVQMQAALHHVLTLRDRSHQGALSPQGLAVARGRRGHPTDPRLSVLRTADQRHLDSAALLTEMLHPPALTVPPAFTSPALPR